MITQDIEEMGRKAAEIIFTRINGQHATSRGTKTILPTELITRGSGEIEPDRTAARRVGA